jgi:MATE family multidrug resistance protein
MNYTYKNIWLINFPVMMSILIEQLINITDAIFLGHVGEIELGASALAGIWYLTIYMLGFGFSLGLQVVIARRNGERHYQETGKTFFQGLLFMVGLAVYGAQNEAYKSGRAPTEVNGLLFSWLHCSAVNGDAKRNV